MDKRSLLKKEFEVITANSSVFTTERMIYRCKPKYEGGYVVLAEDILTASSLIFILSKDQYIEFVLCTNKTMWLYAIKAIRIQEKARKGYK